jgi:hypothetical protein
MQLKLGHRIADATSEYEVVDRPSALLRVGRRRAGPRAPRLPSTPGTVPPVLNPLGYEDIGLPDKASAPR